MIIQQIVGVGESHANPRSQPEQTSDNNVKRGWPGQCCLPQLLHEILHIITTGRPVSQCPISVELNYHCVTLDWHV